MAQKQHHEGYSKAFMEPELAEHPTIVPVMHQPIPEAYHLSGEKRRSSSLPSLRIPMRNVFMNNQFIYGADGRSNAGYGFWQMAYGSTEQQGAGLRE